MTDIPLHSPSLYLGLFIMVILPPHQASLAAARQAQERGALTLALVVRRPV
jgi:hypothetical protein